MYLMESPPMRIVQAEGDIYKQEKHFDWRKLKFTLSSELVLFRKNVKIKLSVVSGRIISARSGSLIFNYNSLSGCFVSERGDKLLKIHLQTSLKWEFV